MVPTLRWLGEQWTSGELARRYPDQVREQRSVDDDASRLTIALANGRLIRISRPNRSRWDQDNFRWGETVWVTWAGSSPVVMQS